MIIDKIEHSGEYNALGERLAKGLKLIQDPSLLNKEDGTYKVDGDDLFYMVQRYTTKDPGDQLFETHREYIDIQAVITGTETIGWAPADTMEVTQPYKPDITKGADPEHFTSLYMPAGTFAVFYPQDAHKPGCDYVKKEQVTKIVVKVKI
jgi:YhcH/YjgK/YiaL family protein